jgi:uncharacterized protein
MMATKAFTSFAVKALDAERRTFEGLASTWETDSGNDRIVPGAFRRTLTEWRASGKTLPLIDQHDYTSVTRTRLGKLMDAEERAEGLWARFKVFETAAGNDFMVLLREGGVDGLSIGYAVRGQPEMKDGVRILRDLDLVEVSAVHWGMNPGALIDSHSVKAYLSGLDSGALTEGDRRELRRMASRIGNLLRPGGTAGGDTAGAFPQHKQIALLDRIRRVQEEDPRQTKWRAMLERAHHSALIARFR